MRYKGLAVVLILLAVNLVVSCGKAPGPGKKNEEKNSEPELRTLQIGNYIPMPDVKMKNIDENWVSIGDAARMKGVLVVFSANDCSFMEAWNSRLIAIADTCHKHGIGVIFINSNDPEKRAGEDYAHMITVAEKRGYAFPYVVDATSSLARAFMATKTPQVFLFNNRRRLVYQGVVDDNYEDEEAVKYHYLLDAVEAMIGEKPIPVVETEPNGCNIELRSPL